MQAIRICLSRVLQIAAAMFSLVAFATAARADIYQWEYIDPADPSQGKQQSTTLAPDGAGVDAVPGAHLYGDLTMAYLIGANLTNANPPLLGGIGGVPNLTEADLSHANLTGASLRVAKLTGANFAQANLTNASFDAATLTDADLTGADVRGANFGTYFSIDPGCVGCAPFYGTGITLAQLYSTASYQAQDLSGINLSRHDLSGGNFGGKNLAHADFSNATLTGADFQDANLNEVNFYAAKLMGANFGQVNLTTARFEFATLTDADFTGAVVRGVNFGIDYGAYCDLDCYVRRGGTGITLEQLYSTASYQARELSGIGLRAHNLTDANFSGQNLSGADFGASYVLYYSSVPATLTGAIFTDANLTGAKFDGALLTGADFTNAEISGANFNTFGDNQWWTSFPGTGITLAQLYPTASYQAQDLNGIHLGGNNLAGANLAGQNLTNAVFGYYYHQIRWIPPSYSQYVVDNLISYATLAGADFTAADTRGAILLNLSDATTTNLIRPDGHINGLALDAGGPLVVRDYDGSIPIAIDQYLAMGAGGTLRMVFEADDWGSTISFASGIPVTLGGTLELTFAADVNLASQVGRTLDLFDWTGVNPTGAFSISSPYAWDLSNLYTTGEVTLTAVPEPASIALAAVLGVFVLVPWARASRSRTGWTERRPTLTNAAGVQLQSTGSPRSGAPWVSNHRRHYAAGVTPIAMPLSYRRRPTIGETPAGFGLVIGLPYPGCAARPWAVAYNAFGVTNLFRRILMSHVARRLCIVVVLALGTTCQQPNSHADALRTVALSGQPAPGTTSGVTYDSFGSFKHPHPNFPFLYRGPVLNDAGQTAFRANLTGTAVDSTNHQSVWSEGSGSLALVARTGNQAPGAPDGVNFRTDLAMELFMPVLNNAGQTAFYGALTDGGLGFWSEGSGSLSLVARSGEHATGTPSGVNFDFASFELLETPVLNDAGQSTFRSYLSGSGVNDSNKFGLWSEGSGSLELVARLGSQAPGLPSGVNHGYMFAAGLNNAGQTVFYSWLTGTGVDSSNNRSVWSEGSGSLALVAREGSPAPGMPAGEKFGNLYNALAINDAGRVAFHAGGTEESGIPDSVWSDASGSLTMLAHSGDHAPGTPSGVNFDFFPGWLMLNNSGQTLFPAQLTGSGVDSTNSASIWLAGSGDLTLVVRRGDHAPGTPAGVNFDRFGLNSWPSLNDANQVAFRATLTGSGVDSTNDRGIWATDQSGPLQLLARTGDPLEVAPGDVRTISALEFVGATGNSNGWPSGFNNFGQLVFWASFTDGSQGVFVSNAVAHVPGDFNNDGTVDAADYVVWRNGLGTTYTQNDYGEWRAHFGASLGAGSSSALPSAEPLSASVPEPTAAVLVILSIAAFFLVSRQPRGGQK